MSDRERLAEWVDGVAREVEELVSRPPHERPSAIDVLRYTLHRHAAALLREQKGERMSEREKLATRLNDVADDLVNHAAEGEADEANYAAHDLRRAARLLREQERGPEVEALARAYRHGWQDRGRHDKGDGPSTMSAWFSERYGSPTSTSEGAEGHPTNKEYRDAMWTVDGPTDPGVHAPAAPPEPESEEPTHCVHDVPLDLSCSHCMDDPRAGDMGRRIR